jgi:isocitrate dehydrogenase
MPNLYGDILSDVAAQIAGSVGLAGSCNIGEEVAMFEAIHGSAPRRAGQNLANPSGLLLGAVMMLVHIGQAEVAEKVHNAWLKTLEDGVHTYDIFKEGISAQKVGTREFADAVIARLGSLPVKLKPVSYDNAKDGSGIQVKLKPAAPVTMELAGIDVFLHHADRDAEKLGESLKGFGSEALDLTMITNRGVKVWPNGFRETFCTDHWRCRFKHSSGKLNYAEALDLMGRLHAAGFEIIKTENLYNMDGQPAYSAGQGA